MGQARFLTSQLYRESLDDPRHCKIREELLEIDKEVGVLYAPRLGLRPSEHWSRVVELPWAVDSAQPLSEMDCLDIGSGFSPLPVYLARHAGSVTCIDTSPSADLRLVLERYGGDYVKEDLKLYVPDRHFDRIFCISVLEHVQGLGLYDAIDRFLGWLNPGGRLLLTFDCRVAGGYFGFSIPFILEVAGHYGLDVVPYDDGDLVSSSDFGEQGAFVGGKIGVVLIEIDQGEGTQEDLANT
jgi:hypothetical protein